MSYTNIFRLTPHQSLFLKVTGQDIALSSTTSVLFHTLYLLPQLHSLSSARISPLGGLTRQPLLPPPSGPLPPLYSKTSPQGPRRCSSKLAQTVDSGLPGHGNGTGPGAPLTATTDSAE